MSVTSKVRLRNLTILLGGTTTILAGIILAPALPAMTTAFKGIPNAGFLIRLTLTMPALFVAIGAPFAGVLLDRLGRKPVLVAALILYTVAGSSGFLLDSLFAILVGRAVLGLAIAGIMSGFTTLIVDNFKGPELDRFVGFQGAFIGLGGMVFVLAAGFLADIGWRLPFLIHLFAIVILPGVLFFVEEPAVGSATESPDASVREGSLPVKNLVRIYLVAFVGLLIFFIFPVQLPFYLTQNTGVTNSQVGLALSFQTLSSVVMALQYRRLKNKLGIKGVAVVIFLAIGLNHLIVGFTNTYWIVVVGLPIGGLGIGLLPPNLSVWLAQVVPAPLRGRAVGGLTTSIFLGQFFAPIVSQPLVQYVGAAATFLTASALALLVSLFFVVARVRRSNR